ncbi:MAG: hypothetical protein C3F18_07075 [Nitrosomonadales bacterium]|nr:MAG: hypothetical protein C3F18_07075 [Nitrosomonadales bacterium]
MVEAQAADDTAQKQLELSQAIQRQILTLNVNQIDKYLIDFEFSTFYGMYAYRELMLWAQSAPQQQRSELMAMTRAGLEAVVRDSGMGLPLGGGKGEEQAAGLLFSRGLPRYAAQPDFAKPATLKWNPASFERQTTPQSIGQSLAAKSLFVQADTSDDGKKLRELLLASALQEFQTLLPLLELGGDKGASYMPALLKLENGKWSVANTSSQLYGQLSLIQGLARLHAVLSLSLLENETIGGRRATEWRKEVRRMLEKVYNSTIKLHLDTRAGSLVSSHEQLKGASERLGAEDAGYALEVLAELAAALQKDDPLRADVLRRLSAQADYVMARLEGKTAAPKTFLVKNNQTFAGMLLRLEDQLAIVNGLLAAEQASGKEHYGKTALALFNAVHPALWSAPAGIFRSAAGQTVTAYDGRLFGLALATWRRLEKLLPPGEARQHGEHLIEAVLKQAGLLQAEGPDTGEPRQPEDFIRDELPQLVSAIAALKREERPEKIAAAVKSLSDQDGDGVPGCRFGGGRFGAAPVIIIQTSVKTPFDPPPATTPPPATATP